MSERLTTPVVSDGIEVDVVLDEGAWPDTAATVEVVENAARLVFTCIPNAPGEVVVTVALSDDASVAELNKTFRGKPKSTNVLSFPAGPVGDDRHIGDIILALETIEREAGEGEIPFANHLQHLVVHGMLHLLGYDHQDDEEAEEMENLEVSILAKLGISNPYLD